jgi:hypothetical protein
MARGMAQLVEYLPSKHKALNTKKKNKSGFFFLRFQTIYAARDFEFWGFLFFIFASFLFFGSSGI